VQTRADQVLELGRGVCQDFAHVMLGACRSIGIPARYVSGYLYDPTLEGDNAASHAWVDVWDDESGWLALDPTHDREQTEAYVRVAVGRDYVDVPPTHGVFKGNASETLSVRVGLQAL
jgi:transglutaminase-like putative cysteine protease